MAKIKNIGGYKVEYLTDTDTSNRPILNDNIYYEYRYSTKELNTKDPLGINKGVVGVPGGNGINVVLGALVIFVLLILRR